MADDQQGFQDEQQLRKGGASEDQIASWKSDQIATLQKGGASDKQINDYFGVKEPDTSAMKAYVNKNLQDFHESRKDADGNPPKEAATFGEALSAGWENSDLGLAIGGKLPDTIMPEHAGFAMRMASQVSQLAGDLPAMVAGGAIGGLMGAPVGGAAGSAVLPGVGTLGGIALGAASGSMAGAFAAPEGIRKLLMDHYEKKGDITTAGDFAERLGAATWSAIKAGGIGAVTGLAGGIVKPLYGTFAGLGTEMATMTTAGAALQGKLPDAQDFLDASVMIGGFHAAGDLLPAKMREIYAKTGARPEDQLKAVENNIETRQDMVSENPDLPPQAAKEPDNELDKALGDNKPEDSDLKKRDRTELDDALDKTPKDRPAGPPSSDEQLSQDEKAVLDRVSTRKDEEQPSWLTLDGFRKNLSDTWDKVYDAAVNKYAGIAEAEKQAGGVDKIDSPYQKAINYQGWSGKLTRMIKSNTINFATGAVTGEGLEPIFKDIPQDKQGRFLSYWMSERALERDASNQGQGKETGIPLDSAQRLVDAHKEEFKPIMDRLNAFDNRMMKYALDADLLSKESYDSINKKSGYYLPFLREMDLDQFLGKAPQGPNGELHPFFEGSERKILNPVEQYFTKVARLIEAAERNSVPLAFTDMVNDSPNGFAIAEKLDKPTGASNEFTFKRNGELETWKTMPRFADGIQALNYDAGLNNTFLKLLMGPASWLRAGTTLVPDFITRHFIRNTLTGSVYADSVKTPLLDSVKFVGQSFYAIGSVMKQSESYQNFLSSGACSGEIKSIGKYFDQQNIWTLGKEAGDWQSKTWNVLSKPMQALQWAAHVSDMAPRLAEFERSGGVDKGTFGQADYQPASSEAKANAASNAREVSLDYDRNGAQTKVMRALTPFMNVGIQGTDRLIRAFKDDPVGAATKATMAITLPTVINWAINHNDSRYQDAPQWEKDLYWLFPKDKWEPAANVADAISRPNDLRRQLPDGSWEVNNGTTVKISKPFELGVLFGSLPERLLNKYYDQNPHEVGDFVKTIMHGVVPNVLPTFLTPVLEQATNHQFFQDRPIISNHMQGMVPELQYNEYTSTAAKQLGHLIGFVPGLRDIGPKDAKLASPQVIDNYIRDWSGTMGQYALQIANKVSQAGGATGGIEPASSTLADYPIIRAFISRNPSQNLQPIQDFYKQYEQATRNLNSMNEMVKAGDVAEAQEFRSANAGNMLKLDQINKALGSQSQFIKTINSSPGYNPDEKRQLIDTAYYQMSMIAKTGNQIIDQNRKSLNAQK